MSIEEQLERLNNNLEVLAGAFTAMASATGGAAAATAALSQASNATDDSSDDDGDDSKPAKKETRGRKRHRYYRNPDGSTFKAPNKDDNPNAVEITKAEFEKGDTPPAAEKPAEPKVEQPAPSGAPTFADVRNAAFKIRDKYDLAAASEFIAPFTPEGSDRKMKDIPESRYAEFIAAVEKKLAGGDDL